MISNSECNLNSQEITETDKDINSVFRTMLVLLVAQKASPELKVRLVCVLESLTSQPISLMKTKFNYPNRNIKDHFGGGK